MNPDIRWITAAYGTATNRTHIAVQASARTLVLEMARELAGTTGLVAVYVPEGTPDEYKTADHRRGRVIEVVKLLPLPPGRKLEDYFYENVEKKRQWPIGLPCKQVCAPPVADCPFLRDIFESHYGKSQFGSYTAKFKHLGPFRLDDKMRASLNAVFGRLPPS
jgi:hypothetical protein